MLLLLLLLQKRTYLVQKKGLLLDHTLCLPPPPPQFLASRAINNCSCLPFLLCACCFCECLNIEPTADFRFPQKKTARYFFLFFFFAGHRRRRHRRVEGERRRDGESKTENKFFNQQRPPVHIHPYSREERKRTSVAGKRRRGRLVQ